jgi:hypothetical protein
MANIANVKVKQGNILSLSGSSVEITGSQIRTTGDLFVNGAVSASVLYVSETIVSSSVIYHSGSTRFGDNGGPGLTMDVHQFTGSVNISGSSHSLTGPLNIVGNVSGTTFTGSFSGDGSQLTNLSLSGSAVTSITAGSNLSASASTGAITIALTSSITGGLTNLTASNISASLLKAATLSASNAEFSGNVLIYGTASLANADAAYVRYEANSGSVVDKIVAFPGIYTVGGVTGSVFSGSGAGITGLTASNFSSFSADVRNQLSATGSVSYNPSTGVISSSALTTAVTQINAGSNIGVTSGSGPTATIALSASVSGLTNLSSSAITGSNILASNSFKAAGSFTVAQITTTGSYVVNGLDQVVFADASSAPLTVTLPTVAAGNAGRQLVVKKIDTSVNTVTISGSVDGALFYELNGPYQSVTLVSDGSTYWFVL